MVGGGGVHILLQYYFTSRLNGDEWPALRPGPFGPVKVAIGTDRI
jgi:hypothetical protein